MARRGNFWLGMMVGAAAGVVTALFYAPKRGDEMRSDMRHAANRTGAKAKEVWGDTKEQASKAVGAVADRSKEMMINCREIMDTGASRVREAVISGREAADEKRLELEAEMEEREEEIAQGVGS